jgi:prepilin-type N-terminal cleavage/methylation domain-containing protein
MKFSASEIVRTPKVQAFTLIEVAIASAILAIALMSILLITSTGIHTARILDRVHVDASSAAAMLSLTNQLQDGSSDRDDLGDVHPDYSGSHEVNLVRSNGLFQVDFTVLSSGQPGASDSRMSVLFFKPGLGGGLPRR